MTENADIYMGIIVAALMLASMMYGYKLGRGAGQNLINYYRNLWIRRVDPNDPRFR